MKTRTKIIFFLVACIVVAGCKTTKKKGEYSPLGKFYHDTNARFNGYFHSKEILSEALEKIDDEHKDNFNKVLPLFTYASLDNPQGYAPQLDKAIEKASTVIALHRFSNWDDDCYLLMGRAQYIKKDYESAEETLEYLCKEYTPEKIIKRLEGSKKKRASKKKSNKKKKVRPGSKSSSKKKKSSSKKKKPSSKKKKSSSSKKSSSKKKKRKKVGTKKDKRPKTTPTPKQPEKDKTAVEATPKPTPKSTTTPKKEDKTKTPERRESSYAAGNSADSDYFLKHKPVFPEAQIWLAQIYIERDHFLDADRLLTKAENNPEAQTDFLDRLSEVRAFYYLQQRKYQEAIPSLRVAIQEQKNKNRKARYSFVLAQLLEMQNNEKEAYIAFDNARQWAKSYEMGFNARLRMATNKWINDKEGSEGTLARLKKMLKDRKNDDYKDQIYLAMAKISLQNGDKDLAIEQIKKGLKNSSGNANQKAEMYYILAELFYESEDFVSAKLYYDSTLTVLPKTDERFATVTRLKNNLEEIALNLMAIQQQDTLLAYSEKSPEELKRLARKMKREEEALARLKENEQFNAANSNPANSNDIRIAPGRRGGSFGSSSSFPMYDVRKREQGVRDFERRYGNRALEDNWRRSNRRDATTEETSFDTTSIASEDDNQLIDKYFPNLPTSPLEKQAALSIIEEAMYKLGMLYRDKLDRCDKSIETFEGLYARFPDTDYKLDGYYYLYLCHLTENNTAQSQAYATKVCDEFPASKYCKIIQDPNYLANELNKEKRLNSFYDTTYAIFLGGNYQEAYQRCVQAENSYKKANPLSARFALLKAMCTGSVIDKEAYTKALREVVSAYPDTPESIKAKEILRLLGDEKKDLEVAKGPFTFEEEDVHYGLIVINDSKVKVNDVKSSIADYHRQFHKLDRLRISNIYLGANTDMPIIVVRKFQDKQKGSAYYNGILKNNESFLPFTDAYQLYIISQNNYREIIREKSIDGYEQFFQKYYLEEF